MTFKTAKKLIATSSILAGLTIIPTTISAQTIPPSPRVNLKDRLEQRIEAFRKNYEPATISAGKITSISGSTLVVSKDSATYTITTDSTTKLRRRFWGTSNLSEMSVGDNVNVFGTWTDEAHTIIKASLVRNTSIQKRFGVFIGTIKSQSGNTWSVETLSRGTQSVTIGSTTKFTNLRGQNISQSDIKIGDKIRIRGMWDRTLNTITEVTTIRDFNLPIKPSPTPTPTP